VRQSALFKQVVKAKLSGALTAAYPAAPCLHPLRAGRRSGATPLPKKQRRKRKDERRRKHTHTHYTYEILLFFWRQRERPPTKLCNQGSKLIANALVNASNFFFLSRDPSLNFLSATE
jgi:hypothetical protein